MESKKYHIFVDSSADKRFAAHIEFLARVSENAADKLYKYYEEALHFIEDNPESCPLYIFKIPVNEQLRYKLFGKRYRIVFGITDKSVFIYDIQDCRQDSDKNLL